MSINNTTASTLGRAGIAKKADSMPELNDKVAIITGAGRGLGHAYALELAERNATVVAVDVDHAAAAMTAQTIRSRGGKAEHFGVDVTDEPALDGMVAAVLERLGRIDILVNNAGGAMVAPGPAEELTLEQWNRVLSVNLTGTWLAAKAVIPAMKRAGRGTVINVSSTTTRRAFPLGLAPYIAAKSGVEGLTRAMARELGPFGITVNAISPGMVLMDKAERATRPEMLLGIAEQVRSEQCIPREQTTEDICGVIAFLASGEAAFMTGQVVEVDGGWALG
ncbi:SDR family NAD(P)-dependent oxidoreductase [Actinomadura rugatobispora]|uniref:SDR family NAD(P)-dependent oxidoreductase n=1 Tax=Actinomadura rugatobispora TaxID=1994 RepID=A0ABW0ZQ41_9ACTN